MIETGQLDDGDQLPSSRMLADNLHVNRNTVARAYGELRQARAASPARGAAAWWCATRAARASGWPRARRAHTVLASAVARCLELGLPPEEIASLAYQQSLHAKRTEVQLAFVECNRERADELAARAGRGDRRADPAARPRRDRAARRAGRRSRGHDLLPPGRGPAASCASWPRTRRRRSLGIVIGPHVTTLVQAQPDPARRADRDLLHDRGAGRVDPPVARRHGLRRGRRHQRSRRPGDRRLRRRDRAQRGPGARRADPAESRRSSSSATCSTRARSGWSRDLVDEIRERKGQLVGNGSGRAGLGRGTDAVLDVGDDRPRSACPGRTPRLTPSCLSRSASSSGIVPPTRNRTSSRSFSRSIRQSSSAYSMCAPERLESPSTAASSWITARRIESGVWKMPGVDDLHARVAQRARDDLRAAVVAVEARLGDDDLDRRYRSSVPS